MPKREEYQVITLTDEEGNEQEYTVLEYVEVDGKEYVVVAPTGEEESPARILRVEDDETLVPVDDEDEFNRVVEQLEEEDLEIEFEDDEEQPEDEEDFPIDEDEEEEEYDFEDEDEEA